MFLKRLTTRVNGRATVRRTAADNASVVVGPDSSRLELVEEQAVGERHITRRRFGHQHVERFERGEQRRCR